MKSKIIFIEGLPNSGKSTSLQLVNEILLSKGIKTKPMYETDLDNFLDNHGNAYLNIEEYNKIKDSYPQIDEFAEDFHKGKLISYYKNKDDIDNKILDQLYKFDFYNLPLDIHYELVDEMWKLFLEEVNNANCVYIVECALLQNPMHVSLIRDNVSSNSFKKRVDALCERLIDYDCMLLYIDPQNIEELMKNRSKRSKGWQNANLLEYTTGNSFGRERSFNNDCGLKEAYSELYRIQKELLEKLSIKVLCVTNPEYSTIHLKSKLEKCIKEFLD